MFDCGWYGEENTFFIVNNWHNSLITCELKFDALSDVITDGILCLHITSSNRASAAVKAVQSLVGLAIESFVKSQMPVNIFVSVAALWYGTHKVYVYMVE